MSQPQEQPSFDPTKAHHLRPHVRPIRGFRTVVNERVMLGLCDARQISDQMVMAPPAAQGLLPLLDGQRTIEEVLAQFGQGLEIEQLKEFVARLDVAGLLHGPVFDALLHQMHTEFDASENLPPAATAAACDALVDDAFGAHTTPEQRLEHGPAMLRDMMEHWIAETLPQHPMRLENLPRAIIVPHVDYARGVQAYATVWGRLRGLARPDRVVILGTNHFGSGTGITLCDKGYITPLGTSPLDSTMFEALKARLGPQDAAKAIEHRFDHEREHSIELQVPWIQHCLGADENGNHVPVLGILVHDPTVNQGESYDGRGLALEPFVKALRSALGDVGGRTLLVSSADLSHAGPTFGDKQALAGDDPAAVEARERVLQHDRDMISFVQNRKPDELIAAMNWQQNPTRWCSIGNIVATLKVIQPTQLTILRHVIALDPAGLTLVSSIGAVMD